MRGGHAFILTGILIVLLITTQLFTSSMSVAGVGPANDCWSTFRGDSRHTGLSAYNVTMNRTRVEWHFPFEFDFTSNIGGGNPSIGPDGTIYLARRNSNHIMAIGWNGTLLWTFDTGASMADGSAPAISEDGTIHQTAGRTMFALLPNGTLSWKHDYGGELCSSPVIADDGTIYVGSADGRLYAIASDGTEIWNFTTNAAVTSFPAVGPDGSIVLMAMMGTEAQLVTLHPNGSVRWVVNIPDGYESMSPSIADDGSVLVYDRWSRLYRFHGNGSLDWTLPIHHGEEGIRARVYIYEVAFGPNGTIYSGSLDGLYAITPNGDIEWMIENPWGVDSPIVGADGMIYAAASGAVWAVDQYGSLRGTYLSGVFETRRTSSIYLAIGTNGTLVCAGNEGVFSVRGEPTAWLNGEGGTWEGTLTAMVVVALVIMLLIIVWMKAKHGSRAANP